MHQLFPFKNKSLIRSSEKRYEHSSDKGDDEADDKDFYPEYVQFLLCRVSRSQTRTSTPVQDTGAVVDASRQGASTKNYTGKGERTARSRQMFPGGLGL